jgi:hypothetical protein
VTLLEQLRAILAALDHAGIEYALVGGLAVAVWGAPRATQDIEPLGFRFRALPMTFSDGMQRQHVSKIEHGALLTVDLLLVDMNLEPIWASRRQLDVEGTPIW